MPEPVDAQSFALTRETDNAVPADGLADTQPGNLIERNTARPAPAVLREQPSARVRAYLAEQRLGMANQLALDVLDDRLAIDDDDGLRAVRLLLQHYMLLVAQMEPLAHLGCAPLRPDDRLYQCFNQFVALLHQQDSQIRELTAIVAELS